MPATAGQADAARRITLAPGQAAWVGDVALNVELACAAPDADAMVVVHAGAVIGFYRVDHLATAVTRHALDPRTLTLRGLVLDAAWQGRGLARAVITACCADLARRHPARRLLALNVHMRNHVAWRLYRGTGFVDNGEILPGGAGGPQRLLLRALGMGQCPP
ncbi:GNAT family N-acetyltransferase [Luteimonas deserti]|uniref:GNAT family N-acetyltransferase n=1 Tax=Luteimonas deserti TaxID=2752306 RepID=A0A7Z0TTN8_9GAMM|nr:GNAT family N-acetyltransferase [Luteimonas deserti]NYZ61986.1 GNAT family N-acetyltransferase [Luteimonas deserti]